MIKSYFKLIRVHHYLKNALIFLPIVFGGALFSVELFTKVLVATIIFSLTTSVVYVVNDIFDREKDRLHPTKKNRPIASGVIPVKNAVLLASFLLLLALGINVIFLGFPFFHPWLLMYLFINFLYSYKLKHICILDVMVLSLCFLIRVEYGAAISGIAVSNWLYVTVLSISLYMGLGKRRNELIQVSESRSVLSQYTKDFLDKNIYVTLTMAIIFYSLWCMEVVDLHGHMLKTIPLVLMICMKYSLNLETNSDGDPVSTLLGDKLLLSMVILYVFMVLLFLYGI